MKVEIVEVKEDEKEILLNLIEKNLVTIQHLKSQA